MVTASGEILDFPSKATILDYTGILSKFELAIDANRERAIKNVAEEYAKGKHDAYLILRILTGDYKCVEDVVANLKANEQYHITPLTIMETVRVLEKAYRVDRRQIAEIVAALLNTPLFECDLDGVFRKALNAYALRNVEFDDAVMVYWGFWSESLQSAYYMNRLLFEARRGA